uniref:EF-hand domain-containing protein n=1 Tax=Taenia asiatica TaxID=60517 RepID=A0A0R3VZZ2_TAEAS
LEVNFDGFLRLWDFVEGWQRYFKAVDRDNSGCYRLSPALYQLMMCRFDRKKKGVIYFDDFVYMCIILQVSHDWVFAPLHKLTEQFRNLDTDRDGYIQIGFEDFLVRVFTVFT